MAYSTQRVTSTGTLALLDISLEYLDRSEISVLYDGVLNTTNWSWYGTTEKRILFSPDVPNLTEVTVLRTTDLSAVRHNFTGGAAFTFGTVDEDFTQVLHIAQEARENSSVADIYQNLDIHGYRLVNLGTAVDPGDAVPLSQLASHDAIVVGYKDAAAASAVDAAASAVDAANNAAAVDFTVSSGTTFQNKTLDSTSNISAAAGHLAGFRNKILNGNFGVNRRAYVSGAAVGSGLYGHDRWKMAASGDTYTFATALNVTTVTVPAGKVLQQVIEGNNLQSGTYTLSWTGTAQGKIGSGAYAASGVTGVAVGGTNLTIQFGPGTVSGVQFEMGAVATAFEFRPYSLESDLCAYYFRRYSSSAFMFNGYVVSGNTYYLNCGLSPPMRASPAITNITSSAQASFPVPGGASPQQDRVQLSALASATVPSGYFYAGFDASAEL